MSERTVLLIAFHFPPFRGSSGMQRTLRFAQHLPRFGWRPIVLTADPRAYDSRASLIGNEIPSGLEVHRAFALDTARQLSVRGRYPGFLAVPDRWTTWQIGAIPKALRLIRSGRVDVVMSTFPIATAHRIGLEVARRSGVPWIAEFRDPMWQGAYPPEPGMNRAWKALEGKIFAHASRVVVTTPGARQEYSDRFPAFDSARLVLIENGYDEESFQRAHSESMVAERRRKGLTGPITFLHSGIVYKQDRDPAQFFGAIALLKSRGLVSAQSLQIVLRASGYDSEYQSAVNSLGIADIIRLEPPIGYIDALNEMLAADGLLILQASSCNAQVPAKLYEYLRAERPIVALTDPTGDTAHTLRRAGTGLIASLDSTEEIAQTLLDAMAQIRSDTWRRCSRDLMAGCSRMARTAELAHVLESALMAS